MGMMMMTDDDDDDDDDDVGESVHVRRVVHSKTAAETSGPKFTSPARQAVGQINRQRELFSEAMKRLENKPNSVKRGFSSDPRVAVNRGPACQQVLKQDPKEPLNPNYKVTPDGAAGYAGAKTTVEEDLTSVTPSKQSQAEGDKIGSHSASSYAAYLAAKKASQTSNSIASSRRMIRRRDVILMKKKR